MILTKQKLLFLFHKKFLRDISKLRFYYGDGYFYKTEGLLKKLL